MEIIYSSLPYGISIHETKEGNSLVATKRFENGELLFVNTITKRPVSTNLKYTLLVDHKYYQIEPRIHFIRREEGYMEELGFDMLMDHSCSPNTRTSYISSTTYEIHAKRQIEAGEKITCDYMSDFTSPSLVSAVDPMETFVCTCKSANCRGFIMS